MRGMTTPPALDPDTAPELVLLARPYDHVDAQTLIRALYDEQLPRYGYADPPEADPSEFAPPHGLFLVGYDQAGEPVACGGYRPHGPDTVEIKKMYVRRDLRGSGHGRRLLLALEHAARQAGARRIILETGVHNHEALALYTRSGFHPTPAYVPGRDERINRAFAKELRPDDPSSRCPGQ